MVLFEAALVLVSALLFLPSFVFFAECAAAVLGSPASTNGSLGRPPWRHVSGASPLARGSGRPEGAQRESGVVGVLRTFVLIPAHDEAAVLPMTLAHLASELGARDGVVVVADNCSDDTANIARSLGAHVIERTSPDGRGKGFALDFGFDYLAREVRPDVVIVLDADCQLAPGSLRRLAASADARAGRCRPTTCSRFRLARRRSSRSRRSPFWCATACDRPGF